MEITPYTWPIAEATVEGWLAKKLGPDVIHELDLAVKGGSALCELIFKYRPCAHLDTGASNRPCVDLILLTAISIVNGASKMYRERREGTSAGGAVGALEHDHGNEHRARMHLKMLKLLYEVPVEYHDKIMGRQYSGRMDWALSYMGQLASGQACAFNDISKGAGYRTLLAVIEAKGAEPNSRASAQLLAYLGCLYRDRGARRTREDISAFGATTDGLSWRFFMLDQEGASGDVESQRAYVPVRESREYNISRRGELRIVLGMIMYILQRGMGLIVPPAGGEDDSTIVGLIGGPL